MEIPSKELLRVLKLLDVPGGYKEDDLPEGVTKKMAEYLVKLGLVERLTIVPPGKEREFYGEFGYFAYQTSEAGRETMRVAKELRRRGYLLRWWEFLIALISGGILFDIIEKLLDLAG